MIRMNGGLSLDTPMQQLYTSTATVQIAFVSSVAQLPCILQPYMVIDITTCSIRRGVNPSLRYWELKNGQLCYAKNEQ